MADRSEGVALRVQRADRYQDGVRLSVRTTEKAPAKKAAKKTAASPSAPTTEES